MGALVYYDQNSARGKQSWNHAEISWTVYSYFQSVDPSHINTKMVSRKR